jgi:hypothetical protein
VETANDGSFSSYRAWRGLDGSGVSLTWMEMQRKCGGKESTRNAVPLANSCENEDGNGR